MSAKVPEAAERCPRKEICSAAHNRPEFQVDVYVLFCQFPFGNCFLLYNQEPECILLMLFLT